MNILLIDDHALFREALLYILAQLGANTNVLEASNSKEAIQLIEFSPTFDLILLDIDLPGTDGLSAMPELRKLAPDVPMIVLSGSEAIQNIKSALDRGAVGYIPKSCNSHEMLAAMRLVLQGGIYIPPRLLTKLKATPLTTSESSQSAEPQALTKRQIEVLDCIAKGMSNKLIARALAISEGTVKLHVFAIMRILNVHNRTEVVIEAAHRQLISPSLSKPKL